MTSTHPGSELATSVDEESKKCHYVTVTMSLSLGHCHYINVT